MNCLECGTEFKPRKESQIFCNKFCTEASRNKRVISQRIFDQCIDCGVEKTLISSNLRVCFSCRKVRIYKYRPKQKDPHKTPPDFAEQANILWNRLRMKNETGGGHCCECGAVKNSLNRSMYCESCKRALNKMILILSEAANLV